MRRPARPAPDSPRSNPARARTIPLFTFLGLLLTFVLGALGLGVWAVLSMTQSTRNRLSADHRRPLPEPSGSRAATPAPAKERLSPAEYADGADLLRYPERLSALEARLQGAHAEATSQADHLRARGDKVAAKDPGSELVGRYAHDAGMLDERAASMRRVMGLVWRTRALLSLRAHVAITARARPDLSMLPAGEISPQNLEDAAEIYEAAAERVRAYVMRVEGRLADLSFAVPARPGQAEVSEDDASAVDQEQERARRTYVDLQNRMDQLADTLGYLADRCLTRQVVQHTNQGVDGLVGSEGLLDEVGEALRGLGELAQLGDRQLADTAMDNLVEDISQLEQAGLDAQAEADAALEIERLLQQFPQQQAAARS